MGSAAVALLGVICIPAASSAAAGTDPSVPVGSEPAAVAVDTASHTIYVANSQSNTVSVINGATDTVTATVPVAIDPRGKLLENPSVHAFIAEHDGIP